MTRSQRVAVGALRLSAGVLGVGAGAVVLQLGGSAGWAYGLLLATPALVSLAMAAGARHRHDAVRLIVWVMSMVLTVAATAYALAPVSHVLDPGPHFRIAMGIAAAGTAISSLALAYNLFVDIRRRPPSTDPHAN
jgi:hypothetical protein